MLSAGADELSFQDDGFGVAHPPSRRCTVVARADSIVRGTMSLEIIQMAKDVGAKKGDHGFMRATDSVPKCVRNRHAFSC
jgi:hypothetical protein